MTRFVTDRTVCLLMSKQNTRNFWFPVLPRSTTCLFRGDPPRIAWVVNLRTQWAAGLRSLPDSPLAALPLVGLVRVLGCDCLQAS